MPQAPGASGFAAEARHQAAQILSRPPYAQRPSHFPDPLAGVLGAIGRAFVWVFAHPLDWLFHHMLRPVFHFSFSVLGSGGWIVASVLALGVGALLGVVLIRRRSRISARPTAAKAIAMEDPSDLERAAEAAEAEGDNELAVRLRFQLGLARLQAQGVISHRFTMTSHQLQRIVRSPLFDNLASRHESITYAKQRASADDVTSARDEWGQLLADTQTTAKIRAERETTRAAR